jgi:hypothetical protein
MYLAREFSVEGHPQVRHRLIIIIVPLYQGTFDLHPGDPGHREPAHTDRGLLDLRACGCV